MMSGGKLAATTAKTSYKAGNIAAQLTTGATLPQLAVGAAIIGGAFLGAEALLGRDAGKDSKGMASFAGEMIKPSRPSYSQSVYQQSTQGLMFGLNSRRTA